MSQSSFRPFIWISNIWKEFGWDSIIYMAALTSIDQQLYEAASIDGANRFQKMLHVTWPGIRGTVCIMLILQIGSIMGGASFDQIFNLYSSPVYPVADIIDTYVYRQSFSVGINFGYAAAQSKDRPGFPEPIVLRWTRPVSLNRVDLYSWYARHQAPTSVSIQVSCDDGATWQEVLPQTALEWMYEDETLECSSLSFPRVDGVTQLKLTVHDGNLKWKHFAINELEAYLES